LTLTTGKLDRQTMARVVFPSTGRPSRRVLLGPGRGLDNAVVSVGGARRMLMTTDPVSIVPSLGMKASAWLSVHLIASDYTTSGLKPEFATFTYNLPRELRLSDAEDYLRSVGRECARLGVTVVAGHTGSYPGGGFTVVGGGTMFGFCYEGDYVDPTMALPGDAILMTKGAAIEAATMLARSFPEYVGRTAGRAAYGRARRRLRECSTVKDALTASSLGLGPGGVTSMHDATEGGVLGGLEEMADASKTAFVVELPRVHVATDCLAICRAFKINPLTTVSEGSLLLTCNAARVEELQAKLVRRGIPAHQIGSVRKGRGLWVKGAEGSEQRAAAAADRYWAAYERSVRAGLR